MELVRMRSGEAPLTVDQDISPVLRRQTRVVELQRQLIQLTETMRIAVIFGGDKRVPGAVINATYNPRHWKSYEAVAEDIAASLRRIGFRSVVTMPDDMYLGERLRQEGVHFAWLNTGGVQGINSISHAPAMLEMFGIPYVGHSAINAATMDNKNLMKRDLLVAGMPTSPFIVWHPSKEPKGPSHDQRFRANFGEFQGPFIAKPISGRASHYVEMVDDITALDEVASTIFTATENPVLIERFLSGREFCVAVCGEVIAQHGHLRRLGEPFSFAAVERVLDEDEPIFTSMDNRPITTDRVRLLDPRQDDKTVQQLSEIARLVYLEFELETLVRLDVRADDQGDLYVLEANPKPDLAAPSDNRTSIVCAGLEAEGMTYDDLIMSLMADRIDVLFSQRRAMVNHLAALLN